VVDEQGEEDTTEAEAVGVEGTEAVKNDREAVRVTRLTVGRGEVETSAVP
jgi:hypothetical protein